MSAPETVIPLRFVAGTTQFGQEDAEWSMLAPAKDEAMRYFEGSIGFEQAFRVTPMVHVGVAGFDIDHRDNARLSVRLSESDRFGFRVRIGTWLNTRIWSVEVAWVAVGH